MGKTIEDYSKDYYAARASGDAGGMSAANQAANALRAGDGQAAQYAAADIAQVQNAYRGSAQNTSAHQQASQAYSGMLQQNNDKATELYRQMAQQGTNRLNAQKKDVNSAYEDTAKQAYVSYMQGQRQMPQQMAALGMTGGASESSLIGAQSSYENNLNSATVAKQKALSDIDLAIADLQASGDIQAAQYILNNADKIADNYVQSLYSDISRNDTNAQNDRAFGFQKMQYEDDLAYRDKQWDYGVENDAYARKQNEIDRALEQAKLTGDFSVMRQFGWGDTQIRAAMAQMNASNGGGGGAGRSNGGSGKLSAAPDVSFGDTAQTKTAMPTNSYDNTSITVAGYGRLTFVEAENMVKRGEIEKITRSDGTVTYRKKR